ncbi:putative beta-lysine N-acetyltransferase [Halobacteriovorax sp. JY17]|uniref:putative beta-lysine N-acetyltransferase n=1 Tax=Halobacteriovorax sp. JY17 TaxID=2014617 RepID=UPI000C3FA915|nr:putative beta-lysine N-acetyltransferase [Halobacteriovorax sp. JY17]PIK13619.1 MAG: putative beta-lysine N-acetyltransferase [Halobacteriovorax sp. JY17]
MNYDQLEKVSGTLSQHGKYNDRLYIMKFQGPCDVREALSDVERIAKTNKYGKIFAKVSTPFAKFFGGEDYELEAKVPNLFNGKSDGYFFSKYLNKKRKIVDRESIDSVVEIATQKKSESSIETQDYKVEELSKSDVKGIINVYKSVFTTYPFPIFDQTYVEESMDNNVRIFGIKVDSKVVAVSSCEIDFDAQNVEMTDFATLPEFRGKGLASKLLSIMDLKMRVEGIKTAYTIARSKSFGMNITFSRSDYSYAGTLKNNTNISGSIESMNVWYKRLSF